MIAIILFWLQEPAEARDNLQSLSEASIAKKEAPLPTADSKVEKSEDGKENNTNTVRRFLEIYLSNLFLILL